MRLFIAEKPELAKAILAGLDDHFDRKDGYFENEKDTVTWCFGHLLQLSDPEDYDERYAKWRMDDLPIITIPWKLKPIKGKEKQLNTVVRLIALASEVVHAGDPDGEGQLLVDELLDYANCKVPVRRLLINDNSVMIVKRSLGQMRCNSEFKGLSEAALARSVADQLYGYNLSRGYTLAAQKSGHEGVLSVGRVQTPILGLVVRRDVVHEKHQRTHYYDCGANFRFGNLNPRLRLIIRDDYPIDDRRRIIDESFAQRLVATVKGQTGVVSKASTLAKEASPPLPYNLLNLQSDAHRKFSIKPDQTLAATQSLREKHQLITYNRSDCQYLNDDQHLDAPAVLRAIGINLAVLKRAADRSNPSYKSRAFNSKNVTAHHAIIPTSREADLSSLSEIELKIYSLIARSYLAQFFPKLSYDETSIEVLCKGYAFKTVVRHVKQPGWTVLYKNDKNNEDLEGAEADCDLDLRFVRQRETTQCVDCSYEQKETKPAPYYTLATLMKDLARVSKYVQDPRIKSLLKEKDKEKKGEAGGIGTPATRTAIIKTLMDRGFIAEKGKSVVSTPMGRQFFEALPETAVNPDMTALWHEEQMAIQTGEKSLSDFLRGISEFIGSEVGRIKQQGLNIASNQPKCSACGTGVLKRRKGPKRYFWGCSNYPECKATFADQRGKPAKTTSKPAVSDEFTCGACGKGLIRRKGKKKGSFWWGCSGFPECRQTYFDSKGVPQGLDGAVQGEKVRKNQ